MDNSERTHLIGHGQEPYEQFVIVYAVTSHDQMQSGSPSDLPIISWLGKLTRNCLLIPEQMRVKVGRGVLQQLGHKCILTPA